MTITGTIATVQPFGLKGPHPGLAGLIQVSDGTWLIYSNKVLTLVPGGPRLRIGAPCQADVDATGAYALAMTLTEPIPFP